MKTNLIVAAAMLAASAMAHASPIVMPSATFTGTVIDFDNHDGLQASGPLDLGHGVTLNAAPAAEVGAYERALGANGAWTVIGDGINRSGNFVAAPDALTFSFQAPVSSVGAFVNQFETEDLGGGVLVTAYGQHGNVLESFHVTIDTDEFGYDEGAFVGFSRLSADIYGFGFAESPVVLDNLTVSAVPEPESIALLLAGIGTLLTTIHSRKRRQMR